VIEQAADADLGSGAERNRLHEWFAFFAREHEALSRDPEASAPERQSRKQLAEEWKQLALSGLHEDDLSALREWLRRLKGEEDRLRDLVGNRVSTEGRTKPSVKRFISRFFGSR
jgi:hypothetical protein